MNISIGNRHTQRPSERDVSRYGSPDIPSTIIDSGATRLAALAALDNTNQSSAHRANDCALTQVAALCRMTDEQIMRIRAGELPLTTRRIEVLRHCSAVLAHQLSLQFDGHSGSTQALDGVHVLLSSLSSALPGDGGLQREALPRRGFYLSVRSKFQIALGGGLLWMGLSIWLAQPWIGALSQSIGSIAALAAIAGIAIIPGFMNAFLLAGLAMDKRPVHTRLLHYPAITILIAAYNEAASIEDTIKSIHLQGYPGQVDVIVVDDGSKDATAALVAALVPAYPWLTLLRMPKNGGKARALNHALTMARASLVITVDADSYLYQGALSSIVERYFEDPRSTRAVAGTVLVRNSRSSWITQAQEWDYFHGISAIKRVQSLFQGTLVAQGAFSLYDRATLRRIGGWPDCVGEDIVLTWAILKEGHRIGHTEEAYLFTNAPDTLRQFIRQRQR